MPRFVHVASGREVDAHGSKAARLARLSSWRKADAPAQAPNQEAPPKAGRGSGRQAWVDYATSRGVEVEDDWTRDDIIDAVEG